MQNWAGRSIGRYQILDQLGEGGMAVVYQALDLHLQRRVAIKVIQPGKEGAATFLKRFEREAKALAMLTHPNIVGVIDYGEFEGQPFLVMEYIPGGTLKQRLGRLMDYHEAARILAPVARALHQAHQNGIIHRDVKPGNILLTESGLPMLSDFGIAKMLDAEETVDLTGTGVGIGTPEYMAPEQASSKAFDHRVDIYSLGVVFFELVTGRKPFRADTPFAVLLKQANESVPRPTSFVPGLPQDVEMVIFKALAKNPEQRYADMAEFAATLEQLAASGSPVFAGSSSGVPVNVRGSSPLTGSAAGSGEGERPQAAAPRRAWVLGGVAALVGIVLVGGVALVIAAVLLAPKLAAMIQPSPTPMPTPAATATAADPEILPEAGAFRTSPADGMVSIYIPGGEFLMGSAAVDSAAKDDQRPQHPVSVNGFWIDQTEVTNRMYALCVQAGVCQAPVYPGSSTRSNYYGNPDYLDYPVVWVTWSDAQTYCQWAGRRLPTEAEWEKAARGTSGSIYPWGDALPDGKHANLCDANCKEKNADASIDDGYGDTSPVGSYPEGASPDQIQDLSGNVWEWVLDWYGADYYTQMVKDSPTGPEAGEWRVLRGGSFASDPFKLRVTYRYPAAPDAAASDGGFRCASGPGH